MIRLGKDKVDERFNILKDGTIVDLNRNVQKLRIHHERLVFKGVTVYQIQMWTNFGWRDGHKWAIHHLDENKLNNALSNLVFLTKSEHTRLHNKGKHLSEETKQKISESLKGKNNPIYRKHFKLSDETKQKLSISLKNYWNNKKSNKKE